MRLLATQHLDLIPASDAALGAELESPAALAAVHDVEVPPDWPPPLYDADAVRFALDWLAAHPGLAEWGFHYMVRRGPQPTLIGAGGFKGGPDAQGTVEVGYSVVPAHQRHGYATEAVEAWVRFAFADPRVAVVVGQTLPSLGPSIRVLEKAGFLCAGGGYDPHAPEGAEVVRYELSRADWARQLTRVNP